MGPRCLLGLDGGVRVCALLFLNRLSQRCQSGRPGTKWGSSRFFVQWCISTSILDRCDVVFWNFLFNGLRTWGAGGVSFCLFPRWLNPMFILSIETFFSLAYLCSRDRESSGRCQCFASLHGETFSRYQRKRTWARPTLTCYLHHFVLSVGVAWGCGIAVGANVVAIKARVCADFVAAVVRF